MTAVPVRILDRLEALFDKDVARSVPAEKCLNKAKILEAIFVRLCHGSHPIRDGYQDSVKPQPMCGTSNRREGA